MSNLFPNIMAALSGGALGAFGGSAQQNIYESPWPVPPIIDMNKYAQQRAPWPMNFGLPYRFNHQYQTLAAVTRAVKRDLAAKARRYHLIREGTLHNRVVCSTCGLTTNTYCPQGKTEKDWNFQASCFTVPPIPFREYARLNKKGKVRADKGLHLIQVRTLSEMKDCRHHELLAYFSEAMGEMLAKHLSRGKSPEPPPFDEIDHYLDQRNWTKEGAVTPDPQPNSAQLAKGN